MTFNSYSLSKTSYGTRMSCFQYKTIICRSGEYPSSSQSGMGICQISGLLRGSKGWSLTIRCWQLVLGNKEQYFPSKERQTESFPLLCVFFSFFYTTLTISLFCLLSNLNTMNAKRELAVWQEPPRLIGSPCWAHQQTDFFLLLKGGEHLLWSKVLMPVQKAHHGLGCLPQSYI